MKDLFGNTLAIGDNVAFNPPSYKGLDKGEITKFTPQMVEVKYNHQGVRFTKVFPRDTVKCVIAPRTEYLIDDKYDTSNTGANFEIGGLRDIAYGT